MLESMGADHVEAFGDSLLVVQQVAGECQCLDGSLRARLNVYLDLIGNFFEFRIRHIPREENHKANLLAQRASGYIIEENYLHLKFLHRANLLAQKAPGFNVEEKYFHLQYSPMHENLAFLGAGPEKLVQPTSLVGQAELATSNQVGYDSFQSAEPIFKIGQGNFSGNNPENWCRILLNRSISVLGNGSADLEDWRLLFCLFYRTLALKLTKTFSGSPSSIRSITVSFIG